MFTRKDVILGVGDDAAITQVPEKQYLATTTDTLLEGVHFLPDTPPEAIAHRAVTTNLSDLAAMGAEPSWINLSLSIPEVDHAWLKAFSDTLHQLTQYYSIQLIGGDTIKGTTAVTITAQGFIPPESVITRDGAQRGDWLYLTGTVGDAALGLDILLNKVKVEDEKARKLLVDRHYFPTPRVLAGTTLRRLASACIDVSDGLIQDLQHIIEASDVGALLHLDKLPISEALGQNIPDLEVALEYACKGGDDYELLFTLPEEHRVSMENAMASYNLPITCIGQITGAKGKVDLRMNDEAFTFSKNKQNGYQHF